jgi:hypothetical protein
MGTATQGPVPVPRAVTSLPPHELVTAPPSAAVPIGSARSATTGAPPRLSVVPAVDAWYLIEFPTSISERGNRIAALVSADDNCTLLCDQQLIIKDVKSDRIEQVIDIIDAELSSKIGWTCPADWSTCIQRQEVERRINAANAVLAQDTWRRLPCYRGGFRPDRIETGCEKFLQLDVRFQDPRLIVSWRGRVLFSRSVPTWIYRDASCKSAANTDIESYALDPKTGTLVVGLQFWATFEGCSVPRWDVHAIQLPALRREAQDHDGGAP